MYFFRCNERNYCPFAGVGCIGRFKFGGFSTGSGRRHCIFPIRTAGSRIQTYRCAGGWAFPKIRFYCGGGGLSRYVVLSVGVCVQSDNLKMPSVDTAERDSAVSSISRTELIRLDRCVGHFQIAWLYHWFLLFLHFTVFRIWERCFVKFSNQRSRRIRIK